MADANGAPPRRVAWVTGGSRGVGRGVAVALGQAGWVVYVSARSSADGRTGHLPGTVEQTADAVTAAGGLGVAAVCDDRDDAAVQAVAARIRADHGRLDLLVNNAWAGYERLNAGAWQEWNAPFWEQPIELFDAMFGGGAAQVRRRVRDGQDRGRPPCPGRRHPAGRARRVLGGRAPGLGAHRGRA